MFPLHTIHCHTAVLRDLIWAPGAAFTEIERSRPILLPLVLGSAGSISFQILHRPYVERVLVSTFPKTLTPEEAEQAFRFLQLSQDLALLTAPLVLLAKWMLVAAALYLAVQLLDGRMSFGQSLSVVSFASLFLILESFQVLCILSLRGIDQVNGPGDLQPAVGLSLLAPSLGGTWFGFLNQFSLLQICYVGYLTSGIAHLNGFPIARAATAVLPVWLFAAALLAVLSA